MRRLFRYFLLFNFSLLAFSFSLIPSPAQQLIPGASAHADKGLILPDSLRQHCDSILISELGRVLFDTQISFSGFEEVQLNRPGRADYRLTYTFTFPDAVDAVFDLPFVCAMYDGQMHVRSGYFLRKNQSDLPPGFAGRGIHITGRNEAVEAACAADTMLAANRGNLEAKLALTQDALWWNVGFYLPVSNRGGDAEEVVPLFVRVDPYTGKAMTPGNR